MCQRLVIVKKIGGELAEKSKNTARDACLLSA
jgi:hypothetical protein